MRDDRVGMRSNSRAVWFDFNRQRARRLFERLFVLIGDIGIDNGAPFRFCDSVFSSLRKYFLSGPVLHAVKSGIIIESVIAGRNVFQL
jgi:hypothetical protein